MQLHWTTHSSNKTQLFVSTDRARRRDVLAFERLQSGYLAELLRGQVHHIGVQLHRQPHRRRRAAVPNLGGQHLCKGGKPLDIVYY